MDVHLQTALRVRERARDCCAIKGRQEPMPERFTPEGVGPRVRMLVVVIKRLTQRRRIQVKLLGQRLDRQGPA